MQAAVGVAQLEKLPGFVEARRRNWSAAARRASSRCEEYFVLPERDRGQRAELVRLPRSPSGPRRRSTAHELIRHLEERRIATRLLFGGNLTAPAGVPGAAAPGRRRPRRTPIVVMNDAFWIGVYPGLTDPMIDYVIEVLDDFARAHPVGG